MTNSQQQIIDSIKLEFEKINAKKSYSGNLIDIEGILGDIDKDKNTLEETRINNEYQSKVLDEMILNDVYLLNEDLNEIGLHAYKGKYHVIYIDIIGNRNNYISIYYDMASINKKLTTGCYCPFYTGFDCISSYTISSHHKTKYTDIKQIATATEFKSQIRSVYEKSLKK